MSPEELELEVALIDLDKELIDEHGDLFIPDITAAQARRITELVRKIKETNAKKVKP
jgi:hypothetical protein